MSEHSTEDCASHAGGCGPGQPGCGNTDLTGNATLTVPTGAEDRILYDPRDYGPCDGVQTVDEIVMRDVAMVHIEALSDDAAYFHLIHCDGREVRGHFRAHKLSPAQRRAMRERVPDETPATAALLITVEDDEIGLGR